MDTKILFSVSLALILSGASSLAQNPWQRNPTPADTLNSTVILPGGGVAFQIYAPNAEKVSVGGDLPWGSPVVFEKEENGVWKGRLSNLDSGVYRYRFTVDGVPVQDPKAKASCGGSSLLTVAPSGDEFFAMKDGVPHGSISVRYYHSKTLGKMRRLHVWTPGGWEKGREALPVLYLVHGGGDDDEAWSTVGAAGSILDNLYAEGKIAPMIVVMPNGTIESESFMGEVPVFVEDLRESIIPFIEENYPVLTGSGHRALAGLSMGGLETMEAMLSCHNLFDWYCVLSSGWFPSDKDAFADYSARLASVAESLKSHLRYLLFTQGGPSDIAYENGKATRKVFDSLVIPYEYAEGPGGHSWTAWRRDLHYLAPKLFR